MEIVYHEACVSTEHRQSDEISYAEVDGWDSLQRKMLDWSRRAFRPVGPKDAEYRALMIRSPKN